MCHGFHSQKRVHSLKRVHSTIEKDDADLATLSACVTWGGAEVRVSWSSRSLKSSRSEKSSWYNRKSERSLPHVLRALHGVEPKCVRHGVYGR